MCNTLKYIEMCDYKFTYIYTYLYETTEGIHMCTHICMCIPQQDPPLCKPDAVHIRPTWT